jgi:phage tail sheath protein FI
MALLSPGVEAREFNISQPVVRTPTGIPACVISPTVQGPAFVPTMATTFTQYISIFGGVNTNTPLGYLSAREWFSNTSVPLMQVRVLGAGSGSARQGNGIVAGAGFVVGSQQPSGSDGALGNNIYANTGGVTGSVYMLGCFMSESVGSTVFSDASLQTSTTAVPIVRGVLFAPSGVVLRLSSAAQASPPPASNFVATEATSYGGFTGSVDLSSGQQNFVMILNGHKGTDLRYPNVITASFDPQAVNYFRSVFNTDPLKTEQAGHLLYAGYDVYSALAIPTGSGIIHPDSGSAFGNKQNIGFIVPSSGSNATHTSNVGSSITPNFENFQDRYGHAFSPWVISQGFGGVPVNLFRFHHLSDGEVSNVQVKISIINIQPGTGTQPYGTFGVEIRRLNGLDNEGALETYTNCSLDPTSPNYIARKIGTINTFFNFDTDADSQKVTTIGDYAVNSRFVRVEVADIVDSGEIDPSAMPFGFRGPQHLVTQGSSSLFNIKQGDLLDPTIPYFSDLAGGAGGGVPLYKASQPPVPMRLNLKKLAASSGVDTGLYWGVQFQNVTSLTDPNGSSIFNPSILGYNIYFPNLTGSTNVQPSVFDNAGAATTTANGIIDSDLFNNNLFSLEKVKIVTGSGNVPNTSTTALLSWSYVRTGNVSANEATKTRGLTVNDLVENAAVQRLAKFSFYIERGFDGTRIFNPDTRYLKNAAVAQEITQATRGYTNGPTVQSYMKSIGVISDVNDVSIQLLTIPGIRARYVTDTAINAVENDRFDCFYIMDAEQYDTNGNNLTGSYTTVNVSRTAQEFVDRAVNSSFAATYFPDVNIRLDNGTVYEKMPPSVAVLGAFAKNDTVGQPFNAPAGFTRGTLNNVTDFAVALNQANSDTLYVARLNLLLSKQGVGPVVWGQKTLLNKDSLLNRVNVRRLLIAIRREVRQVGTRFLFEPATFTTLSSFNAAVQPILARYQSAGGVEQYRVAIDTTTTTQADLDNKTMRGKIFLIPTTSLEFFTIDFVVTNRENFVGG